jgi:hypothetical protein
MDAYWLRWALGLSEMITMEFVWELAESIGVDKAQWEVLYEDVLDRWGDYAPLHLPSFMLGQIEMSVSTIKAYKERPESMLATLESHR